MACLTSLRHQCRRTENRWTHSASTPPPLQTCDGVSPRKRPRPTRPLQPTQPHESVHGSTSDHRVTHSTSRWHPSPFLWRARFRWRLPSPPASSFPARAARRWRHPSRCSRVVLQNNNKDVAARSCDLRKQFTQPFIIRRTLALTGVLAFSCGASSSVSEVESDSLPSFFFAEAGRT